MTPISMPQMLLIAGTGRNTGKTTLACGIIRKFSSTCSVIALKITPHFHKNVKSGHVIIDSDSLYIAEETDAGTGKDSSLMLQAGARKSYFVMAADASLDKALQAIIPLVPQGSLVVCESGGLRSRIVPGLFFMMSGPGPDSAKPDSAKPATLTTAGAKPATVTTATLTTAGAKPATVTTATLTTAGAKPATVKPATEKLKLLANRLITFDGEKIDFDLNAIEITGNRWKLKQ